MLSFISGEKCELPHSGLPPTGQDLLEAIVRVRQGLAEQPLHVEPEAWQRLGPEEPVALQRHKLVAVAVQTVELDPALEVVDDPVLAHSRRLVGALLDAVVAVSALPGHDLDGDVGSAPTGLLP